MHALVDLLCQTYTVTAAINCCMHGVERLPLVGITAGCTLGQLLRSQLSVGACTLAGLLVGPSIHGWAASWFCWSQQYDYHECCIL